MPSLRWWVILLVGGSLGSTVHGQVQLAWKFKTGETFYIEETIGQTQTLVLKGKTSKQEHAIHALMRITVQEAKAEGAALALTKEKVQSKSQPQGGVVGLDALLQEKLTGATFRLTLTPTGQLRRFEGYEAFIQRVTEGKAEMGQLARSLIPEAALKTQLAGLFACLPARPCKRGDRWQLPALESLDLLGSFKATQEFTCLGEDREGWLLEMQGRLTYQPPPANAAAVLKVISGGLTAKEAKGRFVFNAAQGRLVRAETTLQVQGVLTVAVIGQQQEIEVTTTRTTQWRLLDKKPEEK